MDIVHIAMPIIICIKAGGNRPGLESQTLTGSLRKFFYKKWVLYLIEIFWGGDMCGVSFWGASNRSSMSALSKSTSLGIDFSTV